MASVLRVTSAVKDALIAYHPLFGPTAARVCQKRNALLLGE